MSGLDLAETTPEGRIIESFLNNVVLGSSTISITQEHLLSSCKITHKDIKSIMNAGLITRRDATSFWLSVPSIGLFFKDLERGRTEVMRMLKRSKYK